MIAAGLLSVLAIMLVGCVGVDHFGGPCGEPKVGTYSVIEGGTDICRKLSGNPRTVACTYGQPGKLTIRIRRDNESDLRHEKCHVYNLNKAFGIQ